MSVPQQVCRLLEKACCTCIFGFQTELDIGGDCSGANSGNCKTGLLCDATGSTCSEFVFVYFSEFAVVLIKYLFLVLSDRRLQGILTIGSLDQFRRTCHSKSSANCLSSVPTVFGFVNETLLQYCQDKVIMSQTGSSIFYSVVYRVHHLSISLVGVQLARLSVIKLFFFSFLLFSFFIPTDTSVSNDCLQLPSLYIYISML